jgi:NADPH-dependent curcumin reductase CurA
MADGPEKCAFVKDTLCFDAAVDHRAADFPTQLAAACPNGIDAYFENVGSAVRQAVLPLLNTYARIPVPGLIAQYNDREDIVDGLEKPPEAFIGRLDGGIFGKLIVRV